VKNNREKKITKIREGKSIYFKILGEKKGFNQGKLCKRREKDHRQVRGVVKTNGRD